MSLDILTEVTEAEHRIRKRVRCTPLEYSPVLSNRTSSRVYLKLENQQLTGSFKVRGAVNKYLSLSDDEKRRGIVTASSGNHAGAVGYTIDIFGGKGIVYLPETASQAKVSALAQYPIELRFFGQDCIEGEREARRVAGQDGNTYVSPYSDPKIIGGQGTIGVEILQEMSTLPDQVLVPVGGGGLITGVAGYLKAKHPGIRVVGCQPEASGVMAASVREGRILEVTSKPTLADGTAGGLDPDSITFGPCCEFVDEFILVTEEEIAEAMRLVLEHHHMLVEGSAALSIAVLLRMNEVVRDKTSVLLVSGNKVSMDILRRVLG